MSASVTSPPANRGGGAAGGGVAQTQVCRCSDARAPLLALLPSRQEDFCGVPAVLRLVIVNAGNGVSSKQCSAPCKEWPQLTSR